MEYKLQKITIFLMLICVPNAISMFGIQVYQLNYLYCILGIVLLLFYNRDTSHIKHFLILLTFGAMLYVRNELGILNETIRYAINFIVPALIALAIPQNINNPRSSKNYHFAVKCLFVFIIAEFLVVAFEGIFRVRVFSANISDVVSYSEVNLMRPRGLVGSSVGNSHVLAVLSFFFLHLPLKLGYKFRLWLLCFLIIIISQGRWAIVSSFFYFLIYLFLSRRKSNIIIFQNITFIIVCVIMAGFVFYLGFGSRLINGDESSNQVRIIAYEYLQSLSIKDFIWGTPLDTLGEMLYDMRVSILEIGIANHVIVFGVVFTGIFYYLTYRCFYESMKGFGKLQSTITMLFVFVMSNTTNGWFSGCIDFSMYFFFAKIMNPTLIQYYIPQKYLE